MANIKDVIVNITRQTSPLSQSGFGVPLILATNATKPLTQYSSIDDVAADYAPTTAAYQMANEIFSQNPCVPYIYIVGVAYTPSAVTQATYTTSGATNSNFKLTAKPLGINGNYIQFAMVKPSTDQSSITVAVTGLGTSVSPYIITLTLATSAGVITSKGNDAIAAIQGNTQVNALVNIALATSNDGTGLLAALTATSLAGGVNGSDTTPLITALNNVINSNNDWYFLLSDLQALNEQYALDAWTSANGKFYFTVTNDLSVPTYFNSDHTAIMVHDQPKTYPDAAWVGWGAPQTPGSFYWKFKSTLEGIPVTGYSTSQINQINGENANTYISKYGVLQASEGKSTSGAYIDIIIGQDWVQATMAQDVSTVLFTQPKIPYDDIGIGLVVGTIINTLKKATDNGIIAKDTNGNGIFSVSAKSRVNIPASDITARNLTGIAWTAELAGAVSTVVINGTLTY